MTDNEKQRDRIFQVSSNRENPSHKLRYIEASAPDESDCRLCIGSLTTNHEGPNQALVKNAVSSDIPQIAFLEKQAYAKQAYPPLLFYQALRQWPDTFLSLKLDNKIVGYSLMVPTSGTTLSLMSLLVSEAFQGQGLGKGLLYESIRVASKLNYQRVELSVSPVNHSAIYLYENSGFNTTESVDDYLGPGEHRLLMTLLLDKE
ncbi:GNAT family N-acetyltransferase [Idiomarina sp. HP20-50]|uniref:GNAT family N-acetyltransferase n=1 Tax=Idiomarina sp. HP20-50 TaxID=3070813 RepID=UPI00294B34FE|nr:GNAT family N-acetyltransferase [Idiomarina sp. HP20-50]MDV6315153.1 GNAT family N-acetyltransferase [Idiomarina sp. HP20-50]